MHRRPKALTSAHARRRPSGRRAGLAAAFVLAAAMVAGCGERDATEQREDTEQDSPVAPQRPSSTGVPEDSTTSSTEPGDGRLEGGEGSTTTLSGATPGRPQLDGEPSPEPSG